jgi:hypothetical protein
MFARIQFGLLGLLAAVLLFAAPATAAFAQGEAPPAPPAIVPGTYWRGGEVTAVGAASFTVVGRHGESHEILVDAQTQFFDRDAAGVGLADLAAGDRIFGAMAVDEAGQGTAKLVIILGPLTHLRARGTISAIDEAAQSFTFTTRLGRVHEIFVDAGTVITNRAGSDLTFSDLSVGDHLLLGAERREDGHWWANRIGLRPADQTN